jgi:hypothetical protein
VRIDVYPDDEAFLAIIGETHKENDRPFFTFNTISGIIALLLTTTICGISIFIRTPVPDILENA